MKGRPRLWCLKFFFLRLATGDAQQRTILSKLALTLPGKRELSDHIEDQEWQLWPNSAFRLLGS